MSAVFAGLGARPAWTPIKEPVVTRRAVRVAADNGPKRKPARQHKVANPWSLTGVELACVRKLIEGCGSVDGGKALFISDRTFITYISRAKAKVGARTSTHLAIVVDRWLRSENKPSDFEVVVRFVNGSAKAHVVLPEGGM